VGHLDDSKDSQTTLFDQVEKPRLFFLTNQRNLISFLGAGMVVPAKSQFRYKEDSRELFKGGLGLWKDGMPEISTAFPQMDQERAVVIEFDFTGLETFLEKGKVLDEESVVVLNAPLPVSAIKTIYLKSQQAIDDLLLRLTDDIVADRALFGVLATSSTIEVASDYQIEDFVEPENIINFVDRFGGAIKSLELLASYYTTGVDYAALLSRICVEHYGFCSTDSDDPEKIAAISADDRAIIEALLDVLSKTYPEQGLDQDSVLAEIEEKLRPLEHKYQDGIRTWLDYSRKVVSSEKDVRELDDKGEIIKRGVLLFLLRPELERLRSAPDSSISPGSSVFVVATFLSGFFTGMFRLGSEYKRNFSQYSKFSENLLDAFWCSAVKDFESVHELNEVHAASTVMRINGVALWSRKIRKNLTLARVQSVARTKSYELEYDYENHRLSYVLTLNEERKQKVYVELIKPLAGGSEVIRFISPCQDLSGSKRQRVLTKDKIIDLLLRNNRDDMYSSFAVSDSMEAIVVYATQMVHTMDDDEFELLLNHVAKVADEYERDLLGKDFY
jgi:hypothetical protein